MNDKKKMVWNEEKELKKFKKKMIELKKMFSRQPWKKTSIYDKSLEKHDPFFRMMPNYEKWTFYKKGEKLAKKIKKKGTIRDLISYLTYTRMDEKTKKDKIIKYLILASFDQELMGGDGNLYERFQNMDFSKVLKVYTNNKFILETIKNIITMI